ncbi:hypothetical protein Bca4012_082068 [Brassica carinata]
MSSTTPSSHHFEEAGSYNLRQSKLDASRELTSPTCCHRNHHKSETKPTLTGPHTHPL